MKRLSFEEFAGMFDESVREKLLNVLARCDALVCFENQQMDSSRSGERTALMIGPNQTYKTVKEIEGKWLNDLPSQRQYPVAYCEREKVSSQES